MIRGTDLQFEGRLVIILERKERDTIRIKRPDAFKDVDVLLEVGDTLTVTLPFCAEANFDDLTFAG